MNELSEPDVILYLVQNMPAWVIILYGLQLTRELLRSVIEIWREHLRKRIEQVDHFATIADKLTDAVEHLAESLK